MSKILTQDSEGNYFLYGQKLTTIPSNSSCSNMHGYCLGVLHPDLCTKLPNCSNLSLPQSVFWIAENPEQFELIYALFAEDLNNG